MAAMVRLDAGRLTAALAALYAACGSAPAEAAAVAEHLVMADLSGHPSHGSGLTPLYLAGIGRGTLVPNRLAERVATGGDFLLFDGRNGFGQSVGLQLCDAVAAQVATRGVAVFGLRNVHHLGRLGHYGEYLAARGVISATFTNVASRPMVAPYRGLGAVLGTNPVCVAIPRPGRAPVLLDFATSTIAIGKVRVALEAGREVPEGTLIDAAGRPTRDPAVMYPPAGQPQGALVAMAGHKGAGLNLVCELLAAAIAGATMQVRYDPGMIMNNMVGMAFAAGTAEGAGAALEAAITHYAASPVQEGAELLLPGDAEYASRARLGAEGRPMAAATWEAIVRAGLDRGLDEGMLRGAER